MIVCGWDSKLKSQIYTIEPDGSYFGWNAVAIGKKSTEFNSILTSLIKDQNTNKEDFESLWKNIKTQIINNHFHFLLRDNSAISEQHNASVLDESLAEMKYSVKEDNVERLPLFHDIEVNSHDAHLMKSFFT